MNRLLLFIFSITCLIQSGFAQNLIDNGDFETGSNSSWSGIKNLTIQSVEVHNGSYAAETTKEAYFSQTVTTTAGSFYQLSCNAKNEVSDEIAFFSAQYNDGKWKYLRYETMQTTTWSKFSFVVNPNSTETTSFRVAFYKPDGSKVWIDDIEIVEITQPDTLGSSNEILSTTIGGVDQTNNRIFNIPKNSITAEQLINALEISPKAKAIIFSDSQKWVRPTSFISDENTVQIFAENGAYETYNIVTGNQFIKSLTDDAILDNENYTVSNVTPVYTVETFISTIELFEGATVDLLDKTSEQSISDQSTTTVTEDMIIRVTGTDASQDYTIELRDIATGNSIISMTIGSFDENSLTVSDIPANIDVDQLKSLISISDYASLKITDNSGSELSGSTTIDANSQIRVTAENGDEQIYSITFGSDEITDITIENSIIEEIRIELKRYTLEGTSELHITSKTDPISLSSVNLNSVDSWLFYDSIKPQMVADNYLTSVQAFGQQAILDENVRVVQYDNGAVIIPHIPEFEAVEVFSEPNLAGTSKTLKPYDYYKTSELGELNDAISSFKVKRGYYVTFAQDEDGMGYSKVFIADEEDLIVNVMPEGLESNISFARVIPWRWPHKKGWTSGRSAAEALNCSWHYNWSSGGNSTLNIEYIPIKQKHNWPGINSIKDKRNSTHLLGFNEPDRPDQANISVETALKHWPELMSTGLRLGSPAPSDGGLNWLYKFIDECDKRNYRVDFIAMHWYLGCQTAQNFKNRLKQVHERTGRPIWITEWNNGANWTKNCIPTYEEQRKDIKAMIEMLDDAPFVERYSIYEYLTKTHKMLNSWDPFTFTAAGEVYRDKISPLAFNRDKEYENAFNKLTVVTNLKADLQQHEDGSGTVTISWDDVSDYENGVKIERSANGGEFEEIARMEEANITSYLDDDITFGEYRYRVRQMIVGVGNSAYSNVASVTNLREGDVNIALQKTVTASSARDSYAASNAVDGDISSNTSRWLTETSANYPHWIEVDFGGTYEITFLKFYTGWNGYNNAVKNFKFQYWNGSEWTDLLNITNNSNASYAAGFTPTVTEKVRLSITDAPDDAAKLYEIEVFGSSFTTSSYQYQNQTDIWLYPNPAKNVLYINGLDKQENIKVYNISGSLVKTTNSSSKVPLDDIVNGVYFIEIKGYKPMKFIKQ